MTILEHAIDRMITSIDALMDAQGILVEQIVTLRARVSMLEAEVQGDEPTEWVDQ